MDERPGLQVAAYVAAALLVAILGLRLLGRDGGGGGEPVVVDPGAPAARASGRPPTPGGGRGLWVHVAGAVRQPGVYLVPAGSRVDAAVQLAGGAAPRADLKRVNLAAALSDGQQVVVPARGQALPAGGAGASGSSASPASGGTPATGGASASAGGVAPISLATATVEQLDAIDGIGPTLARRIVEYRDAHGGFRSVEELREVDGIGEQRFAALRDAVRP
jgi:competence protein ComEA